MDHESAKNDGRDDVARNAKGKKRDQGGPGNAVISTFGRCDTFYFTCAKLLRCFRIALGFRVAQECRWRAANAGNGARITPMKLPLTMLFRQDLRS